MPPNQSSNEIIGGQSLASGGAQIFTQGGGSYTVKKLSPAQKKYLSRGGSSSTKLANIQEDTKAAEEAARVEAEQRRVQVEAQRKAQTEQRARTIQGQLQKSRFLTPGQKVIVNQERRQEFYQFASRTGGFSVAGVGPFGVKPKGTNKFYAGVTEGIIPDTATELATTAVTAGVGAAAGSVFNVGSRIIGSGRAGRAIGQVVGGGLTGAFLFNTGSQIASAKDPGQAGQVFGSSVRDVVAFSAGARVGSRAADALDNQFSFESRALGGLQNQPLNFLGVETTPPKSTGPKTFDFLGRRQGASTTQEVSFTAVQEPSGRVTIKKGVSQTRYVDPSTGKSFSSVDLFGGGSKSTRPVTKGRAVSRGRAVEFTENTQSNFGSSYLDIPGEPIQRFPTGSVGTRKGRVVRQINLLFDSAIGLPSGGARVRGRPSGRTTVITRNDFSAGDSGFTGDRGFTSVSGRRTGSRAMRTLQQTSDLFGSSVATSAAQKSIPSSASTQADPLLFGGGAEARMLGQSSLFSGTGQYERTNGGGGLVPPQTIFERPIELGNKPRDRPQSGTINLDAAAPRQNQRKRNGFGNSFASAQPQSPLVDQPQVPSLKQPPRQGQGIANPLLGFPESPRRGTPFTFGFPFTGLPPPRTPRLPKTGFGDFSITGSFTKGDSEYGLTPSFSAVALGIEGELRGPPGSATQGLFLRPLPRAKRTRKTRYSRRGLTLF